ncbi:MAG: dTDP-4-dehydrorhamnose 3,5-epimerase [Candidatus Marinimicrobia bacterium]|nr:dTDP-4-dehydrorhamnose 3,5-epimerase [Candidatus Neomarinimicrobiota bacterium]
MIEIKEIFKDVFKFDHKLHKDDRGFFSEVYKVDNLKDKNISLNFIQDNISFSQKTNTIRGLHYQEAPYDQSKYITVLNGKIWDVFVDLRKDSSKYLQYGYTELSANESSLLIPKGFAHGFCTMEPNTLVLYKVDNLYSKDHEKGIIWNDKNLEIPWPLNKNEVILSEKDKKFPELGNIE